MKGSKNIVVYGFVGTRFDHSINNISILQKYAELYPYYNFFGVTPLYQIFMVTKGSYEITPAGYHKKDSGVGLINFKKSTHNLFTKGFKWDINNDITLVMGSRQSSSNEIVGENVEIDTEDTIVLSLQFDVDKF